MVSGSCMVSLARANHFADGIFRHANRWQILIPRQTLGLGPLVYAASRMSEFLGTTQIRHQRFF